MHTQWHKHFLIPNAHMIVCVFACTFICSICENKFERHSMDFIDMVVYCFGCNIQQYIYMRFAIHSFLSSSDFSTRDSIAICIDNPSIWHCYCHLWHQCGCKTTREPNRPSDSKKLKWERNRKWVCVCVTIACRRYVVENKRQRSTVNKTYTLFMSLCTSSNAATQRL